MNALRCFSFAMAAALETKFVFTITAHVGEAPATSVAASAGSFPY